MKPCKDSLRRPATSLAVPLDIRLAIRPLNRM